MIKPHWGGLRSAVMLLLAGWALSSWTLTAQAGDGKPLTLEEALRAADAPHPDMVALEAERSLALADQQLVDSRQDVSLALEGRLQRVKPTLPPNGGDYISDNSVRLTARKNLFDFGRTSNAEEAARSVVDARDQTLLDGRAQRRLDIMARFFDVLMADMRYTADNEFLAATYVAFDHARDRQDQKLISQVDVMELETKSQEWLVKRNDSEKRQRLTRALLADAMNQPGQLVSDLEDPKLQSNERAVPEYEALLPIMLENNPRMKAQRQLLAASQQRLESLRADIRPRIDAELEAADYPQRKLGGRDDVRAGLVFTWPIYQGGRNSAEIAREQAQFQKLQAESERLKRELSQALLSTWLDVNQLRKTARRAAKVEADYRDLALDRARAQYEMEFVTTLGTTMANTLEAKISQRSVEYRLALTLAKLEALIGGPLPSMANKK